MNKNRQISTLMTIGTLPSVKFGRHIIISASDYECWFNLRKEGYTHEQKSKS